MVEETSKKENDVKFPEFSDLKKEQIEGMSHEEKLKLIDREAQTLYDFCLEKGLSQKDMSWCLKPLFGSPPEYVKKVVKDNSKFCLTLAVIFGLIAVFAGWNPAYNQLTVHGKLALMKLLPYWDWRYLYEQECAIPNPFVAPEPNITKEECSPCFELQKTGLESLVNATEDVVANDFLLADYPAKIEDGIKGWPKPNITTSFLSQLYSNHEDLKAIGDCQFNSSTEANANIVYDFFKMYTKKELPDIYYASWENCDLKAAKHFRLFYKRPYFLPQMAGASKTNSFLVAKGKFKEPVTFAFNPESSGLWITVVKGEIIVQLVPIEGCKQFEGCKAVRSHIKTGEAVLVPHRMWLLDIIPNTDSETVILGSTAQWDDVQGPPPTQKEISEAEKKTKDRAEAEKKSIKQ